MVEFSSPPTMAMPRAKQSPQFSRSDAVWPTTVAWPVVPEDAWMRATSFCGTANSPNG